MRCRTLWLPAMLYAKVAAVLRKIPQDQYHQRLHSWEEAEILVTNSEGEFVSHDVHHFAELSQQRHHRRRRNAELYQLHSSRSNDEHESFFVNITTGSFTHHLKLVHSGIQLHPDAKIIHNHHNYTTHEDFHPSYHSCFMTGHVVGKEKLSTSLSLCGEVQGLLELDDEHWFIEQPHPDEKSYVTYRRSAIRPSRTRRNSDDQENDPSGSPSEAFCGHSERWSGAKTRLRRESRLSNESNSEMTSDQVDEILHRSSRIYNSRYNSRRKSYAIQEKWIETIVVADYSVVRFHDDVVLYICNLIHYMNTIYAHDALKPFKINIVLKDVILERDRRRSESRIHPNNADRSLGEVKNYASQIYNQRRQDHLIYLTKEFFGPAGFAPVKSMCRGGDASTLVHEDGFQSVFVMVHETGHNLGMEHDGENQNMCGDFTHQGSIMSPLVQSNFKTFTWSHCSQAYLRKYMREFRCINTQPSSSYRSCDSGTQRVYTLDEQCAMDFGKDFSLCKNFIDHCDALWCSSPMNPTFCRTKSKAPPLDGTPCRGPDPRKDYHCFGGRCIEEPNENGDIDGSWSNWGSWSQCSAGGVTRRTCGYGAQNRRRACNNPEPHGRGRPCEGESLETTICRIGHPCPPEQDNRAAECRATSLNLLPAESPSNDQCKLFCRDDNHRERPTNQLVSHGTPCSYDDPHKFCIFGKCENYGCDIGGQMKYYNECGICDGRTSDCTFVDQNVRKTNRQSGVSVKRVYTIPKGAYNVAIREENSNSYYTGHFLGLKDARGTFLIRGEYVTKPGVFRTEHNVVHGNTLWKYQNVHTQDVLETKGPTTEEYTLSMKLKEARKTYNIKITYALKGRAIKPPPPPSRNNQWNYQWKHMTPKRGRCSVECGNGHKTTRVRCFKYRARRRGRPRRQKARASDCSAHLGRPPPQKRIPCVGTNCKYQKGPWSECLNGVGDACREQTKYMQVFTRTRTVECRNMRSGKVYPETACQNQPKPPTTETCASENIPECPGEWEYGPWSDCLCNNRATCSCDGMRRRKVTCSASSEVLCRDMKPSTSETCRAPDCTTTSQSKCVDQTVFCEMGTDQLIEYCQSPKFIEICCAKCRNLGSRVRAAHVAVFDEREFDFSKLEKPGGWLTWPWGRCEMREDTSQCEMRRTVQCERDHSSRKTRRKAEKKDRSILRSPLTYRNDNSLCDESLRPMSTAPCPCS